MPGADDLPVPRPTALSQPFWDGCARGELLVQRCTLCGHLHSTPQEFCRACNAEQLEWKPVSGRGRVYSYTTVWRPQTAAFEVPYVVAIVDLDEGPQLLTNLVDCDVAGVVVGMEVEVCFRPRQELHMPMVRPCP